MHYQEQRETYHRRQRFDADDHFSLVLHTTNDVLSKTKLECGPIPNVMVALPNTGGTLCSTPQSLADAYY